MTTSKPRMPAKLGAAGARLWRRVVAEYEEFDPPEVANLEAACRQADANATLEGVLVDGGMVVAGSTGQARVNGAVAELRLGRLALARLLAELRLPRGDDEVGRSPKSLHAQRAATARWERRGRLEAVPDGA